MRYDNYALRSRKEQSPTVALAKDLLPILNGAPPVPPSSYCKGGWTQAQEIALLRAILDLGIGHAASAMQKVRPGTTNDACKKRIRNLRERFCNFVKLTSSAEQNEQRRTVARKILSIIMKQTLPPRYERCPSPWLREHDIALLQGVIDLGPERAVERVQDMRPSATRKLCNARLCYLAKKYGVAEKRKPPTDIVKWLD